MNVNKPRGWSSHDVVARVRRLSGQRRVGHAGTLDPLAEGVLPVLLGRATRLADLVSGGRKRYLAEVRLGSATSTDDAEGEVVREAPVPTLNRPAIEAALACFEGEIQQVPPRYSAIKVGGQRAYALARKGDEVTMVPRPVTIHGIELMEHAGATLRLDVRCSRGTYIRSLARDLAEALGTAGHLAGLVRTEVGPFRIEEAVSLEQVAERGVAACLAPPATALAHLPRFDADEAQAEDLRLGRALVTPGLEGGEGGLIRVYDPSGRMLLVGTTDGLALRPKILLA